MRCRTCGAVRIPGDSYCHGCGAEYSADTAGARYCGSCGSAGEAGDRICQTCGIPLRSSARLSKLLSEQAAEWAGALRVYFQSGRARANPWIVAAFGGIVAVLLSLVLMGLVRNLAVEAVSGAFAPDSGASSTVSLADVLSGGGFGAGEQLLAQLQGVIARGLIKAAVPDAPSLLLTSQGGAAVMNGELFMGAEGSLVEAGSIAGSARWPITGLILVPIVGLAFGGFSAVRYGRDLPPDRAAYTGASIAPVYAAGMVLLAYKLRGGIPPFDLPQLSSEIPLNLSVSAGWGFGIISVVFWSLALGVLAGSLGGIAAVKGGSPLRIARDWILRRRLPYGAQVVAVSRVLMASFLVISVLYVIALLAAVVWGAFGDGGNTFDAFSGVLRTWPVALLSAVAAIPSVFASLFLGLHAVPLGFIEGVSDVGAVTALTGLLDVIRATRFAALPVLLIPAALAVWAGHASARIAWAQGMRNPRVQGAMVALPYAVAFMFLAYMSSVAVTVGASVAVTSLKGFAYMGVPLMDAALSGAIWGLLFGGLGGMLFRGGARATEVTR